jgi:DNA polymerase
MDDRGESVLKARRILTQRLESLQRTGVEQIRRVNLLAAPSLTVPSQIVAASSDRATVSAGSGHPHTIAGSQDAPTTARPAAETLSGDDRQLLQQLNEQVRACTLCRELACSRKQTVFGVGNPQPRVVFFGEAPGADEDRQGEPFVGRAGQLLTKIIEACGWQRSDVYIMNVLKCRPPDNRNPLPNEVENCRPFFERQFEILNPEYIVCVGTVPAQALLQTTEAVGKLRGRWHRYGDAKVLVTYHPSYLLRNPSAKKYVWDDMQVLLKEMGLPIPGKK